MMLDFKNVSNKLLNKKQSSISVKVKLHSGIRSNKSECHVLMKNRLRFLLKSLHNPFISYFQTQRLQSWLGNKARECTPLLIEEFSYEYMYILFRKMVAHEPHFLSLSYFLNHRSLRTKFMRGEFSLGMKTSCLTLECLGSIPISGPCLQLHTGRPQKIPVIAQENEFLPLPWEIQIAFPTPSSDTIPGPSPCGH